MSVSIFTSFMFFFIDFLSKAMRWILFRYISTFLIVLVYNIYFGEYRFKPLVESIFVPLLMGWLCSNICQSHRRQWYFSLGENLILNIAVGKFPINSSIHPQFYPIFSQTSGFCLKVFPKYPILPSNPSHSKVPLKTDFEFH